MRNILFIFVLSFCVQTLGFVSSCASYDIENTHPDEVRVGIVSKCMVKGDTLYLDGAIDPYIIDELKTYPEYPIRKVSLNSDGGLVKDAIEIARFIRENNIETFVRENAVCKSACTLLFQAGVKRVAHKTAKFMYHSARFLPRTKDKVDLIIECTENYSFDKCGKTNEEKANALRETTDLLFSLYEKYGIASDFYRYYKSLPDEVDWYLDGNYLKTIDFNLNATDAVAFNIVQVLITD